MAEDKGSKTEQATPRKREKAREEGQAATSRDLTAGLAILASALTARAMWHSNWNQLVQVGSWTIGQGGTDDLAPATFARIGSQWLVVGMQTLLPVIGIGGFIGLAVSLLQTRFMFSLKPLEPKLEKLSPVNGFKRIFSIRGMVEAAKSSLKVVIIMGMALWVMWGRHTDFVSLTDSAPSSAVNLSLDLMFDMVIRVAVVLVVIGAMDYGYQWWEFERGLRMSRQEIIDEMKQQEGDPYMRARRKATRRNMLQQGMSRETRDASVVVTNPTHFAVALMYRRGMVAPKVVAKGQNNVAQRILGVTRKHGIPEVRNVSVARALYKATSVGDYVPIALYQAVAEILAFVRRQALERRQRQLELTRRRQTAGSGPV